MTTHRGILSFGAYAPRYRLSRQAIAAAHRWMAPSLSGAAHGSRAFCSWDEDSITMAVEAARDCLIGMDRGRIAALTLASTTFPYADLQNSAIVGGALALGTALSASDAGGSQRAGTGALIAALTSGQGEALVVASDRPRAKPASVLEMQYGAGAAAFAIGEGEAIARLMGHASVSTPFVDHFRASDQDYDYAWEERWIREEGLAKIIPRAAKAALRAAGLEPGDIAHFILPTTLRGAAQSVAKQLGIVCKPADGLEARLGYAGAAQPLMMLAHVLEEAKGGERILVIGFGQGADALVLEATGAKPPGTGRRGVSGVVADAFETTDYMRMLSFYGEIEPDWGMRGERTGKAALTEAHRNASQLFAFEAGRCGKCKTVQFPQLAYCVNPGCGASSDGFEVVSLADAPARQLTYTADALSYHPAPPLYVGFVQFENGARLMMETVDAPGEAIDVAVPLRMVFRIKERDAVRGFNRYFWKATPVKI